MALNSTEEAQTRALIAQNAALLSLASNEAAIISELGAGDVTIADLPAAASIAGSDLILVRQGTTERSALASQLTAASATETVSGIVELATTTEARTGTDTVRAVTPAGVQFAKISQGAPTTIASAATVDIGAANSVAVEITGTTTISSFGTNYNGPRFIRFASSGGSLTHSASLNLPGNASFGRLAGDTCIAYPNSALSGWNVIHYQRQAFTPQSYIPAASGANSDITSLAGLTSPVAEVRQIQPIGASVAANALTITASALSLEFRSTTLTSGAVSFVEGTPANLVIPSTATLGTINGVQSRIVVLALNNAGTIELAAVNIAGGNDLSETGLISTTAIAGGSNSASTIYSTTARTGVPYRVIGYVESTQATAGTWATTPSTVQGCGGQALAAMSLIGWAWQNVTGSRILGTTYYNTTGRPITVAVTCTQTTPTHTIVNGAIVAYTSSGSTNGVTSSIIVPAGANYSFTNGAFFQISELR
jgi:hypothetical protein